MKLKASMNACMKNKKVPNEGIINNNNNLTNQTTWQLSML